MQTLKLRYEASKEDKKVILSYQRQFSSCMHVMFSCLKENKSLKECRDIAASLNNIELLDSWMRVNSIGVAQPLLARDSKVIFGGRKNFIDRAQGKISREEFLSKRIGPLFVCGEATHYHGNRKFSIQEDLSMIIFKPCRSTHIELHVSKNLKKTQKAILRRLYQHSVIDDMPISFMLDQENVYISFDEAKLFGVEKRNVKRDRVFAIDMNPNYVGWSVCDWKDSSSFTHVASGVVSIKAINDAEFAMKKDKLPSSNPKRKHIASKRNHEVIEIAKFLVEKAKHYGCETFAIEDLVMKQGDKHHGKRFNRLTSNMWCRGALVNNLKKRCNTAGILLLEILPQYSSFVGNLLYRSLKQPDMVNASIEISRRAYEFKHQHIDKDKLKVKNIVTPVVDQKFNEALAKSLEEFSLVESFSDWKTLFGQIKDSKMMYRVPFQGNEKWSKLKTRKSNVGFYNCICSLQF